MKPLKRLTFLLFMLLTCPVDAAQFAEGVEVRTLFQRKEHGYNNVRIPAICATNSGTLLAFAEGREAGDAGKIDLILRRSEDQGKTWSEKILIWSDGENTCGNPCPVVDRDSGTVWLLCTWNIGSDHEDAIMAGKSAQPRRVFVLHSSDEGKTWFEPKPLPHLRENDWGWYATGPCNAIQLTRGVHKGRLVVPANHSLISDALKGPARYRSHLVFSDDFGKNWKLGPVNETLTNESTVLELEDGSLMQNMRSYHGKGGRAVSVGANGGDEMGPVRIDETLISPVCQGSVLRYRFREK